MSNSPEFMNSIKTIRELTRAQLQERKCCGYIQGTRKDPFTRRSHYDSCEIMNLYKGLNDIEIHYLKKSSEQGDLLKSVLFSNLLALVCVSPLAAILIFLMHNNIATFIILGVSAILYVLVFYLQLTKVFESTLCGKIYELKEEIESLEQQKINLLEVNQSLVENPHALTKKE